MSDQHTHVSANTVPVGAAFLLFFAVVAGGLGLLFSSQASAGASIVAFACLLGIWARIAQAAGHHREVMQGLAQRATPSTAPPLVTSTQAAAGAADVPAHAPVSTGRTVLTGLTMVGGLIGLALLFAWAEAWLKSS